MEPAAQTHEARQSLGELLLAHGPELIELWYKRWRSEGAVTSDVSEVALKDLAPLQLEVIAKALKDGTFRTEPPRGLWRDNAHRLQPEERVPQSIPIEEVVHEYWLLVSTVRDWIRRKRISVPFDEFTYFYEAMFELVGESVRRYAIQGAKEVTHERAEYLASLAHQMRGPLSVMTIGITRLQSSRSARNDERLLSSMQRNLARLTTQVTGVLRLERYKGEELPVHIEDLYPGRLIDNVLFDVEDEAAAKGIDLEVRANRSARMTADPDLLMDALANIIQNAVKYTERGSVRVEMVASDSTVKFRVIDTGPGIDETRQAELFKPLHPNKRGGFGLGLAVAHRVITAQGGEIGVESEIGTGSTFWFTLPKSVKGRA